MLILRPIRLTDKPPPPSEPEIRTERTGYGLTLCTLTIDGRTFSATGYGELRAYNRAYRLARAAGALQ